MSAPTRLGRYPVRRRIGSGSFATVWLAHDEHLDSPVAVKVLADNWTGDLHVRQRFVEEGRFLRKVESPHVVPVYDAGELEDGRPFLVMAYADEGTLADRIERSTLTPAETLHIVSQVGEGLAALHARGVLHRDVKPANVLFRGVAGGGRDDDAGSAEVTAMLGDLGLGKAMDMSSRLTMIGGTPTYVAPEQAAGERLDARADQYSLAALTYYLLAGRPPYAHASLTAASDPPPAPPLGGGVPPAVDDVVRRALSKDREDRYDDVRAYVAALASALRDAPEGWVSAPLDPTRLAPPADRTARAGSVAVPDERHGTRPRRTWLLPGAAAALLLGLTGGWALGEVTSTDRTFTDETGTISVTVPEKWASSVRTEQWTPPDAEVALPALSAGSTPGWNRTRTAAPGVFVGIVASEELPERVPQHPECETPSPATSDVRADDTSMTQVFSGCPGTDFTVERVIQANDSQLVWVQVRSEDRPTADRVLASVSLSLI